MPAAALRTRYLEPLMVDPNYAVQGATPCNSFFRSSCQGRSKSTEESGTIYQVAARRRSTRRPRSFLHARPRIPCGLDSGVPDSIICILRNPHTQKMVGGDEPALRTLGWPVGCCQRRGARYKRGTVRRPLSGRILDAARRSGRRVSEAMVPGGLAMEPFCRRFEVVSCSLLRVQLAAAIEPSPPGLE